MKHFLRRVKRWLPRRLTTRISLTVVLIVVIAGLVTIIVVNHILVRNLRSEYITSGKAQVQALGENLANPLAERNLVAIQEDLDGVVQGTDWVEYAFAFGQDAKIIHTFTDGFPADLLQTVPVNAGDSGEGLLLRTEEGLVRDFGYKPLNGLPAEVHLGISQERISVAQRKVTRIIVIIVAAGCVAAAGLAYGFSFIATRPLAELTKQVKKMGRGHLDERIDLPAGDEVGDLAVAFNRMGADLQESIEQLKLSEEGYRNLIAAASSVGEGIALFGGGEKDDVKFLFVNEAFAKLTGYQERELLSTNAASVLHPDTLAVASEICQTARKHQNIPEIKEVKMLDRKGNAHILETTGTLIDYQGQRAVAWFMRDITRRKRRAQELRRRNRELMALNAVSSAMSGTYSPNKALELALEQVLNALGLRTGWVFSKGDDEYFRLAASKGDFKVNAIKMESFKFPNCPCGEMLESGNGRVISDLRKSCVAKIISRESGKSFDAHATVPLLARDRALGVMSVATEEEGFQQEEMQLLAAVGRQMGVALENAQLMEELREREQLRGELLARVIQAQEEERKRISRELHDEMGSSLNALVFGLKTVEKVMEEDLDQAIDIVGEMKESASYSVQELQSIIYDLRPSLLDDLGLIPALRWYTKERLGRQDVTVDIRTQGEPVRLAPDVDTALFRICQEALTNVAQHAEADEVILIINFGSSRIEVEVVDNGCGFEPARAIADDRQALGILGMRERAELLGGKFEIVSQPGRGTHVKVTVPRGEREVSK